LLDASKDVGLEVNMERTTYMAVSRHQNPERNHSLLISNKSFENVANFQCLGTRVTNENRIHK